VSVHVGWCVRFVLSSLSDNWFRSVFIPFNVFSSASRCIWTLLSLNSAILVVSFVICVPSVFLLKLFIHPFVYFLSFQPFVYIYIRYNVLHKIPHSLKLTALLTFPFFAISWIKQYIVTSPLSVGPKTPHERAVLKILPAMHICQLLG